MVNPMRRSPALVFLNGPVFCLLLGLITWFNPASADDLTGHWRIDGASVWLIEGDGGGEVRSVSGLSEDYGVVYGKTNGKDVRLIFTGFDGKLNDPEGTASFLLSEDGNRLQGFFAVGHVIPKTRDSRWRGVRLSRARPEQVSSRIVRFSLGSAFSTSKEIRSWISEIKPAGSQRFDNTVSLAFDWEMPKRYGFDRNDNNIVDLPNSVAYTTNRGDVPANSINNCSSGYCADGQARFAVDLFIDESSLEANRFAGSNRDIEWRIDTSPTNTLIRNGRRVKVLLPEGPYRVSVELKGRPRTKTMRTIEVTDFYVGLLGDSFASGEGSPEDIYIEDPTQRGFDNTLPVARWADTGRSVPMRPINPVEGAPELPDWIAMLKSNGEHDQYIAHHRSHRSSHTAASRYARVLEDMDPRSSVTFVNLAQTGARIDKGILGKYSGAGGESIANSYNHDPNWCKSIGGGRWQCRDIPSPGCRGASGGMCPQIDTFRELISNRQVDQTFISIGGNDIGFAPILAGLTIAYNSDLTYKAKDGEDFVYAEDNALGWKRDSTIDKVIQATLSGRWDQFDTNALEGAAISNGMRVRVPGLNNLQTAYQRLSQQLADLKGQGKLDQVTLVGPPFFGLFEDVDHLAESSAYSDEPRKIEFRRNNYKYCFTDVSRFRSTGELVANGFTGVSPAEIYWTHQNIYTRLVSEMSKAVRDKKGLDHFLTYENDVLWRHGLCMQYDAFEPSFDIVPESDLARPIAWFNSPEAGAAKQTGDQASNHGSFHPNRYGHAYTSTRMLKQAREIASTGRTAAAQALGHLLNTDSNDQISEAVDFDASQRLSRSRQQVSLRSVDDVSMYDLGEVGGLPFLITIYPEYGQDGCVSVTAYDENGAVIATNAKALDDNAFRGRPMNGTIAPANCDSQVPSGQDNYQTSGRSQIRIPAQASCDGQNRRKVYLAISNRHNQFYDPVTGRADTPRSFGPEDNGFRGFVERVVERSACQ